MEPEQSSVFFASNKTFAIEMKTWLKKWALALKNLDWKKKKMKESSTGKKTRGSHMEIMQPLQIPRLQPEQWLTINSEGSSLGKLTVSV